MRARKIQESLKFQEPGEGDVYKKMGVGKYHDTVIDTEHDHMRDIAHVKRALEKNNIKPKEISVFSDDFDIDGHGEIIYERAGREYRIDYGYNTNENAEILTWEINNCDILRDLCEGTMGEINIKDWYQGSGRIIDTIFSKLRTILANLYRN